MVWIFFWVRIVKLCLVYCNRHCNIIVSYFYVLVIQLFGYVYIYIKSKPLKLPQYFTLPLFSSFFYLPHLFYFFAPIPIRIRLYFSLFVTLLCQNPHFIIDSNKSCLHKPYTFNNPKRCSKRLSLPPRKLLCLPEALFSLWLQSLQVYNPLYTYIFNVCNRD